MIICAGQSEKFTFARAVGIGVTEVAIELTQLCLEEKPSSLLFVGTAGSYGERNIFDIVESQRATMIENSFFTHGAYTPLSDIWISSVGEVSRETIVNSSHYITTDTNINHYYREKNIAVENMEFYGVAKVARRFNIPVKGVFIVTNYCDKDAHEVFIANHKEAMQRLTNYIKENYDA